MYALQFLLVLLGCIEAALPAAVTSNLTLTSNLTESLSTTSAPPISFSFEENQLVINVSHALVAELSGHFTDTCPLGSSQKPRLGKRGSSLTPSDVQCITNIAEPGLTYAAKHLQASLLLFPTDFPSLTGPLVGAINALAAFIQNPPLFNPKIFSGPLIHTILAVFTGMAFTIWWNGLGSDITQNLLPFPDLQNAVTGTISGCPSLTFSWTSTTLGTPTLSTTVVPDTCDDPENDCPCSPVNTAIAYEGTDPDTWAAEILQYNMIIDSPVCFPNTKSLAGPTSTYCVCAGSSVGEVYYSTIKGASNHSACAYSASSDLPLAQYTPMTAPTVPASITSTSCSPTKTSYVETIYSPAITTNYYNK